MDKENDNDQIANVEKPSPIVTTTENPLPMGGDGSYKREQGRTLGENNTESPGESSKMTAKERLLQNAERAHAHSQGKSNTQSHGISPS